MKVSKNLINYACNTKNLCFLILFLLLTHNSYSQQPKPKAFPTAEGFGKYATGGRGGAVIKVTNLNDSGPGSLRQALQYTSGPRTVIFEVGGTIDLKSVMPIKSGNVTIAGQTAPGGGILLKNGHLLVQSSNVIIRFMRFRYGTKASPYDDSLSITAWGNDTVENVIVDHCSLSWGRDENFEVRVVTDGTARNVTIQNSLLSGGGKSFLLYGPRVYNISVLQNLLALNRERNIRSDFPSDKQFDFEMINNIVYGFVAGTAPSMGSKFAVINNIYKASSQITVARPAVGGVEDGTGVPSETDAYITGNLLLNGIDHYSNNLTQYLKKVPFRSSGTVARPASVIEDILPTIGAYLPARDSEDTRILQRYADGNGVLQQYGTYPTIQDGIAKIDTDNDGMPDEWEIENGLNPNNADDRNFVQPDGYTNLEYFLNGMSLKTTTVIKANAGENVSICQDKSTTLTATGGVTYLWNTGATTSSIVVSPDETTTYTVTAYDTTGNNSDTADVTVTVNPLPEVNAGSDVTINSGETVTLTAKGADSYRWSNGEVSSSIKVSPTNTTTYRVTGIKDNCEASDTVTVFSVEASVKANAGEDVTICTGTKTTLTATGGASYKWNTGETAASITVNPKATTTYTVTAYDSTGTNSDSDDVKVTVNPLPKVNAGNDITIKLGESTTLTATGATTYSWNTKASGESITVSPKATTTYTVTGISNGCEATDSVKVIVIDTVEVIANAGTDQKICAGTSATLTATGGTTYKWNTGETTASITVNPNETTTYKVTAFDSTGNKSDSDDVKVTVNPLPKVDAGRDITITLGESTTLTAIGATAYKWDTGDTTASVTVNPKSTRSYSVIGTSNGCEATNKVKVTVLNPIKVVADAGADQNICAGTTATLTATGGTTYKWNTGETSASITVNPKTTTTYSVTAYDNSGKNSDKDEVVITVNPLPKVDAGKDITIALGESATLTATGATTYRWSTKASGASITINPKETTTYTVVGKTNDCESRDTIIVTVVQPETAVVADAGANKVICPGSIATLTATGGDRYLWSTGEKTASIDVSPISTTKYSVTAYIGDASNRDEVTVFVGPSPNVSITNGSEATILEGEFITLSATGANTYKWSNGATQPNIAVRPNVSETYDVVGYINDCSSQKSITVNVFEKVVANAGEDVAICLTENTVLTADGPANSEYLWSTGETSKSITVEPSEDTEYSVMVYHALDSDTDSVMVTVNNCNAHQIVEDTQELEFLIHPNPTNGELHINISGLTSFSSINLYDLSGKSLYNEIINEGDQQKYIKTLNLSNYASGIYLLQLVDNQKVITKKVVLR